tara:strand:- start:446 stop:1255 length:810 start_codon:yes stop_codon:yes gene_type:complete
MSLGKLFKDLAPVLIGSALGPGIGSAIAGQGFSPFVSRLATGAITSKLMGGKNKDAVRNALLAGIGGMAFDRFGGAEQAVSQGGQGTFVRRDLPDSEFMGSDSTTGDVVSKTVPADQASEKIAEAFKPKTFSGELLQAAGVGQDNLLARLLNTRVGEGLTAGLLAQLLAGDDEEDTRREFERRPFGQGGPGGQLGGIRFAADGGQMGFPRRTGGIDPSEGSGTKDDVPAMLMAGEFVLTKDAVKGLGDGNQRKGIQRAYDMMSNLEARA